MEKANDDDRYSKPGQDDSQAPVISKDNDVAIRNRAENLNVIEKLKQKNENNQLLEEVRKILEKLTPQNLKKLTGDLINLPINNEERLKSSIDVIFEKSIDEQVLCKTYVQLCKALSQIKVPSSVEPSKNVSFRTMLLSKCQKEFDTSFHKEIDFEQLLKEVELCTEEQKKAELKELAEEKLKKSKRRLGNIRFIGELFNLNMLTQSIMNDCIDRLLKQESDENLECICTLLTTIGKEVDKPNNASKINYFFERLDKIIKKKDTQDAKDTITARTRFMILNVIDLRKNNWIEIPRKP